MPNPTTPSFNGPKLLELLKDADKTFPARYEFWDHQTRVLKARFDLLTERGFTEVQALHLVTQDWENAV